MNREDRERRQENNIREIIQNWCFHLLLSSTSPCSSYRRSRRHIDNLIALDGRCLNIRIHDDENTNELHTCIRHAQIKDNVGIFGV